MCTYNVWDIIDIIFRREHRETALHHSSLSLSKKLFPVGRVGKIKASREVGIFFSNFIFYKLECTGGGGEYKISFLKI